MFFKLFTFFALVAVAFASPKPDPQILVGYPGPAAVPAAVPLAYSAYPGYSAPIAYAPSAYPYAYGAAPYFVRR